MRKIILLFLMFAFLISADKTESYKIEGMHCGFGCVNKVKTIMNSLDGMKVCEVDFEKSLMVVEYDETKITSELILSELTNQTTYKTALINEENKKSKKTFWSKFKGIFSS